MDDRRADVWIRVGAILFLTGLVATAFDVIPFFYGERDRPVWLNSVAAGGLTVGLGLALVGILIMVRSPATEVPDDDVRWLNRPGSGSARDLPPAGETAAAGGAPLRGSFREG
jgi:hypothetical protein